MIRDIDGTQIYDAYDYGGNTILAAYDVGGNEIFPDSISLKVMTFNIQGWNGINSQQAMLNAIFQTYNADIIGFQEFCSNGSIPTVAANSLTSYPYLRLTNHKNYNAVASKFSLSDWTVADYQTQDQYDISTWNETRCYMRGYFNIGDRRIAVFNTHLCVHNQTPRHAQAAELFALAQQEEYCIITGDFNSTDSPLTETSPDYINIFKPFVDAGYNLANSCPERGFTNTHFDGTTHLNSLADLTACLDNIIVSGNISISSIVFDATKLDYQNGQKFDHIPVIVTLTIDD